MASPSCLYGVLVDFIQVTFKDTFLIWLERLYILGMLPLAFFLWHMNLTCLFLFKKSPQKNKSLVATESLLVKEPPECALNPSDLFFRGLTFHFMGLKSSNIWGKV